VSEVPCSMARPGAPGQTPSAGSIAAPGTALGAAPNLTWTYAKLALTGVIWGGTFIAGRIVAAEAAPFSAAFLRFVIASLVLAAVLYRSAGGFPKLPRRQWLPVLLLGLSGVFFYNYFFFAGLETITAGRASLIIATNPVVIAVLAAALFREPLHPLKLAGIFLSMSGAMVVISRGDPTAMFHGGVGLGEFYIFGCVASWVAYSLIGKIAMRDLSPLAAVTYSCLVGMFCLAPPAFAEGLAGALTAYGAATWLGLLYLGLFGSAIGFIWYYQGIRVIGPSRAGVFINIVPVSALVLAFLILAEPIDGSLIVGALLVGAGVTCTNRGKLPA